MSFDGDIKDFNDKFVDSYTKTFRGTALSLFGKVVTRTPVDTGRLRGNWFASIGSPSTQIDGSSEGYPGTVERAVLGDTIYLVNNLPYAKAIENGSSEQAPAGMIKVTIAEFEREVERQARKNKV